LSHVDIVSVSKVSFGVASLVPKTLQYFSLLNCEFATSRLPLGDVKVNPVGEGDTLKQAYDMNSGSQVKPRGHLGSLSEHMTL
jgi:hypothetical protein